MQHSTNQAFMVEWSVFLAKRRFRASLEFAKRHLNNYQTMRSKIFWSNYVKIELFSQDSQQRVWRKPGNAHHLINTTPTVKKKIVVAASCRGDFFLLKALED